MPGLLKIYFTNADLARTRLAQQPDPLWELVMSLGKMSTPTGGLTYQAWRAFVRKVQTAEPIRIQNRSLRELVPRRGDFPDFLNPIEALQGLDAGVDAIMATRRARLRSDVDFIAQKRKLPAWIHDLADGDPAVLRELGATLTRYHDAFLLPYWPTIQAHVDADRAVRARAVLDGGSDALLNSFRPALRWNPPVLEADYPVDWPVSLDGRGITLIPSYFCWRTPVTLIDQSYPTPVLVYPIEHDLTLSAGTNPLISTLDAEKRLAALIGRTRSQILIALSDPHTTGELARRFDVSAATISQHTSILRNSELIATRRDANTSVHIATPLGNALLRAR